MEESQYLNVPLKDKTKLKCDGMTVVARRPVRLVVKYEEFGLMVSVSVFSSI